MLHIGRYYKTMVVKNTLNKVLREISVKHGVNIFINPINKHALPLIYDGAMTKSADICLRTEKSGPLGGYIVDTRPCQHPGCAWQPLQDSPYIKRRFHKKTYMLTDKNGLPITSDLDILMINAKHHHDNVTVPINLGFGELCEYEYKIISEINFLFSHRLQKRIKARYKIAPIIQHGSFNRYKKAKLSFIHFPQTIYLYTGKRQKISATKDKNQALKKFFSLLLNLKKQGFIITMPESWNKACVLS